MGASTPEARREPGGRTLRALLTALLAAAPLVAGAQEVARPELRGRVLVGADPLDSGTVVLHHVSADDQGEIDSVRVGADGDFAFQLPRVPDPARSDVYFASVRHAGVLYFGRPLTVAVQLDSVYVVQAWDTLMAPAQGVPLVVQARNLFLESDGGVWRVTDLFQVRNDGDRTIVAQEGGAVWRYPLPPGVRDAETAQAEFADGGPEFEGGDVVVRNAVPPGERIYVIRYVADDPFLQVPMPGTTEVLDVLVREPAPAIELPGLTALEPVELEQGTTYRRYGGSDLSDWSLRIVAGQETALPPVRGFSVLLALTLAVLGVWAARRGAQAPAPAASPAPQERRALVLEIARLDEVFEGTPHPTPEERGAYEARRADLLRLLRGMG